MCVCLDKTIRTLKPWRCQIRELIIKEYKLLSEIFDETEIMSPQQVKIAQIKYF